MKYKLMLIIILLVIPSVLAQTQIYGGETKTIETYNSTNLEKSCVQVFVIVNASKSIQFNSENIREYSLENCEHHIAGSLVNENKNFDLWICDCINGKFDLILSVLPNTINTYIFSLVFYNESILDNEQNREDEDNSNEQIFSTAVTSLGSSRSSGGGGVCVTEWTCTDWSECINNQQTRICYYPENFCEPEKEKPLEIQSCVSEEEPEEQIITEKTPQTFFGVMTGAVIGTLGTKGTIGALIFVIGIMGVIIFTKFKKRKN